MMRTNRLATDLSKLPDYKITKLHNFMNGVLVVDKPAGLTSHDVVNRVRKILGQRTVGHLGTLDPMATGVLPLVTGGMTRLAQFYTHSEKTYEGVIRFGFATDTYDSDGDPTSVPHPIALEEKKIKELAVGFVGKIEQTPPPFSAKKISGVPAYRLARKKQDISIKPVVVEVKEFEIVRIGEDYAHFRARVGSGTYLRSIAHDLGQKLGCGGHLNALRRTSVAEFALESAHALEEIEDAGQQGRAAELLFHPRQLLPDLPPITVNEEKLAMIRNGRSINLPDFSRSPQVKVFFGKAEFVAIATRIAGTLFHAAVVFSGT